MSHLLTFPAPHFAVHNSHAPAEACAQIEVEQSIVLVGANGSGKTRLGTWLDLYSPQRMTTFRISAQKSLVMPDNSVIISTSRAESDLLYGYSDIEEVQQETHKMVTRWGGKGAIYPLADFGKLLNFF
ncbi:hypothetical protein [Paraburkholderia lacunae]|uniref:hypothetical protein n=1 Tax=Paraburkholderia lacunae TaxID=2211104 RepID=UPI001AD7E920|nr:hypothetical protein [Paraburkholderia lacunae]